MMAGIEVYYFKCPTCRARMGEQCSTRTGESHKRRVNLYNKHYRKPKPKRKSVQTISGGAFESNRRKH